jgi:hypothetical protein
VYDASIFASRRNANEGYLRPLFHDVTGVMGIGFHGDPELVPCTELQGNGTPADDSVVRPDAQFDDVVDAKVQS